MSDVSDKWKALKCPKSSSRLNSMSCLFYDEDHEFRGGWNWFDKVMLLGWPIKNPCSISTENAPLQSGRKKK